MRDAIELEWEGVPSAAVIAEPLTGSADAMKQVSGMPDYRYVIVPDPVGSLNPDQIRQRAKEITPQVLELLTRRGDAEDAHRTIELD